MPLRLALHSVGEFSNRRLRQLRGVCRARISRQAHECGDRRCHENGTGAVVRDLPGSCAAHAISTSVGCSVLSHDVRARNRISAGRNRSDQHIDHR